MHFVSVNRLEPCINLESARRSPCLIERLDAIAGAEVRMRVVVESTPAKSARVLLVRCQLIVNARVPHRVFSDALDVIIPFSRVHVADEFSVEIEFAIGRSERNLKVVHGIPVFQLLGIVLVTFILVVRINPATF